MMQVENVARFFVQRAFDANAPISHLKLQKLCYYAQAWYLAFTGEPLFNAVLEAWVHGPVCPDLYYVYRKYGFREIPKLEESELQNLTRDLNGKAADSGILHAVWNNYGNFSARRLEALTHQDSPWRAARVGLGKSDRSENQISTESMREYYQGLLGV